MSYPSYECDICGEKVLRLNEHGSCYSCQVKFECPPIPKMKCFEKRGIISYYKSKDCELAITKSCTLKAQIRAMAIGWWYLRLKEQQTLCETRKALKDAPLEQVAAIKSIIREWEVF